jgi:hypothetical protein
MSMLGDPDYNKGHVLDPKMISGMSDKDLTKYLLNSYTVMNVNFDFPEDVKYPNIAVQADKNVTIYPLRGSDVIVEGREFLLARKLGCKFEILQGYHIPYKIVEKEGIKELALKPFSFIGELQQLRNEAKKK